MSIKMEANAYISIRCISNGRFESDLFSDSAFVALVHSIIDSHTSTILPWYLEKMEILIGHYDDLNKDSFIKS